MKHLNQIQLLEWAESGRVDTATREHLKQCAACADELASLRNVFQKLAQNDPAVDLDPVMEEQFRLDVQRKIRLLPEPSLAHRTWDFLQRWLFENYVVMGATAAALLVFSIAMIFRYDRIYISRPTQEVVNTAVAPPPADVNATSMAVAEAVAAAQNLEPRDFFEASVETSTAAEDTTTVVNTFSPDPFRSIADLDSEEVTQLKALLKSNLKDQS